MDQDAPHMRMELSFMSYGRLFSPFLPRLLSPRRSLLFICQIRAGSPLPSLLMYGRYNLVLGFAARVDVLLYASVSGAPDVLKL
jgi:hypothetical protein